jgi:nucleotide-binding universal stress UspA family protein
LAYPSTIVVASDGSDDAYAAARTAVHLCEGRSADIHVVTVVPATWSPLTTNPGAEAAAAEPKYEAALQATVQKIERGGATVTGAHVRQGSAGDEIVGLCREVGADLLVAGTRGLGRVRGALLGSVASSLIAQAPCPVLIVRQEVAAN